MIASTTRLRRAVCSLTALSAALISSAAHAQRSTTAYAVERLGPSAVWMMSGHPSRRLTSPDLIMSALVQVPSMIDPVTLGLLPVSPGIAVLRGDADTIAGFIDSHENWPIEITPPLRHELDLAVPYVGAAPSDLQAVGIAGEAGVGAYVGIVDTGIDITHADFRDASGNTRIAWLLDLSQSATTSALDQQFGGRVYARADIQALLDSSTGGADGPTDTDGHGTHVSGIAASNGNADVGKYAGVAPGADLVVVRATTDDTGDIEEANAALGVKFVFDRATVDNRPAVVNLSLGTQYGPHDGTSTFEQSLAALSTGAGRAIVVAASNEGGLAIHTSLHVSPDSDVVVPISLPGVAGLNAYDMESQVFVWLTWPDAGNISVALRGPDGTTWMSAVDPGQAFSSTPLSGVQVDVVNDIEGSADTIPLGTHGAVVTWAGPFPAGTYSLVFSGSGGVEAYVEGTSEAALPNASPTFPRGALTEGTIGIPASSASVIAVGCVQLRGSYLDRQAETFTVDDFAAGTRCSFSSAGPAANGPMRPDLLAPGQLVISALSSAALLNLGDSSFSAQSVIDPTHGILSGTSMSTPFVTGAAAILFAQSPTLTQEQVRSLLQASAGRVSNDGLPTAHPYAEGAGVLNVARAVAALNESTATTAATSATTVELRLGSSYLPATGVVPVYGIAIARDASGAPADVNGGLTLSLDAASVSTALTHATVGLYRFSIVGQPGNDARLASLSVRSSDGSVTASTTLAIGDDTWDAHQGLTTSGGGCSVDRKPRNSAPAVPSWLAAALVALVTVRSRCGRDDHGSPTKNEAS